MDASAVPRDVSQRGSEEEIATRARLLTARPLRSAVEHLPSSVRHLAGFHFGWWDLQGAPLAPAEGKGVRIELALLSSQAVGGEAEQAVPAAVAVELVHNASLLQDDVIDGDRLRRGRPALWTVYGIPAAILAGDALFFLATQVLLEAGGALAATGLAQLNAAVQDLIDGEYADVTFQDRPSVPLADVQAMAQAKTGALIAAACSLGALAGGADDERASRLGAFGAHVGAAFQLTDDLLGIWGDPQATGKPQWSDLSARKKSLPISHALASGSAAGQGLADLFAVPGPLTERQLAQAARLVDEAGGRSWAESEARLHIGLALQHLHAAEPEPAAAATLTSLARLITGRDR